MGTVPVFLNKCGGCGEDTFKIYSDKKNNVDFLVIECIACKSKSLISVDRPTMQIDWHEGIGCITVFEFDKPNILINWEG